MGHQKGGRAHDQRAQMGQFASFAAIGFGPMPAGAASPASFELQACFGGVQAGGG